MPDDDFADSMLEAIREHGFPPFHPTVREIMAKALRIAAWNNGAPKRCRRRDCRSQNRCHINVASDGKSSCPGGFSDKALEEAALMMLFAMSLLNAETLKF